MNEMIERVAKAIHNKALERGELISSLIINHLAVAAIEAMKEPTEEMIGNNPYYDDEFDLDGEEIYKAMIEAALK